VTGKRGANKGEAKTRDCIYCGSPISSKAVLCPTCKNYQSAWRNHLTFAAGLAGFFTLLAGAALFVGQQAEQAYTSLFWRNTLTVLAFDGGGEDGTSNITVSNSGDGPLLLSRVEVHWKTGSEDFPFNKTVPIHALENFSFSGWAKSPAPQETKLPQFAILASPTGVASQALFDLAARPSGRKCINFRFYNPEHSNLARMKEHYKKGGRNIVVGEATAYVYFFGGRRATEIKSELPVVAAFEERLTQDCSEIVAAALGIRASK